MKRSWHMVLVSAVTFACAAATAQARPDARDAGAPAPAVQDVRDQYNDDPRGRRGRNNDGVGPYIPLESIIGGIQARTPGRLVGVRGPNGAGQYRIIWETPDGRVITFIVDARTGQILR